MAGKTEEIHHRTGEPQTYANQVWAGRLRKAYIVITVLSPACPVFYYDSDLVQFVVLPNIEIPTYPLICNTVPLSFIWQLYVFPLLGS